MDENSINAHIPSEMAPTSLERVAAVHERLAAHEITNADDIQVFMGVFDQLGLFHERTNQKGVKTKDVTRQAKKTRSVVDWLKIMAQVFQVNRGGRIVSVCSTGGRRAESEINRALQILDRFLSARYLKRTGREREKCLADVYRAATGVTPEFRKAMIAQVHDRLQTAKKTPLGDSDYAIAVRDALAVQSQEMRRRHKEFLRLLAESNDPDRSEEELANVEAELGRLVGSV